MKLLRQILNLFRRRKLDAEMTEEMRLHLELQTKRNVAAGMSANEARFAALRQFGNVASVQEQAREVRGWMGLESLRRDLGHAGRGLLRAPGHAGVVMLTLALGIGTTTAIFSVIYGVLLDPYPYARSSEIWAPSVTDLKTNRQMGFRVEDYQNMARLPAVASAMATSYSGATLFSDGAPEIVTAPQVTGTGFPFLDVPPVLGRGLTPADVEPTGEARPVTVLSFKLWQRLFNGDPGVLGRTLDIDRVPHTIVGVMPPRFGWYTNDGLWRPLPELDLKRGVRPIVRLKPGQTPQVAAEQLHALLQEQAKKDPGRFPKEGFKVEFTNYLDVTVASGAMRTSLLLLLGAVGFLLAIACINAANLQLARGVGRGREIALRLALGASRARLVRQLLTESVVLALGAGVLGILLAAGFTQVMVGLMPDNYVPNEARVTMNGWVLGFSTGIAVLSGIVAGVVPAWQCTRPDLNEALKEGGHAATTHRGNRLRHGLAIAQVTLSVVLLVGASLMAFNFIRAQQGYGGFHLERMLMLRVPLDAKRYTTFASRIAFAREFADRALRLPGVAHVSVGLPPGVETRSGVDIPGQAKPPESLALNFIDADYFATYGIALISGRLPTAGEIERGDRVALVSESAARCWGGGVSPLGRPLSVDSLVGGGGDNLPAPNATKEVMVVGIVADVRLEGPAKAPPAVIFVPYTLRARTDRTFVLRTQVEPAGLLNAVRAQLRAMDPEQPMLQPITFEEIIERQTRQPRFNMALFGVFAVVALALAAAGIYSVLAYAVSQRTREIGVRMALGAARRDVLGLFLLTGLRLVGIGLGIGLVLSLGLARIMRSQIYDGAWLDPAAFAAALLLLALVALLACFLPARRAAQVDPMAALRSE